MLVHTLVAELAVEALDVGILRGLAGRVKDIALRASMPWRLGR